VFNKNMKKINLKKGFTLIELLVVVAIIGILASVVLASLNSARTKGSDAAIKAALSGARAQAELFYDTGSTYASVCTTATTGIQAMVLNAAQKLASTATVEGTTVAFAYNSGGAALTSGDAVCHDSAGAWAAIVSLKATTTDGIASAGWCVDSSGASKAAATLTASSYVCGS
jgi:prepilin-type N-terminal cleavage/methylation domain-containing protein